MIELEKLAFRTRLPSKTASPDSPIFQLESWILLRFVWEVLQFSETGKSKATVCAIQFPLFSQEGGNWLGYLFSVS